MPSLRAYPIVPKGAPNSATTPPALRRDTRCARGYPSRTACATCKPRSTSSSGPARSAWWDIAGAVRWRSSRPPGCAIWYARSAITAARSSRARTKFQEFRPCCTSATSMPASRSAMSRRSGSHGQTWRSTSIPAGTDSTATRAPTTSRHRRRSRLAARSSFSGDTSGKGAASILALRLEAEHRLAVHAAGGIPVEADVGGGGVRVAPDALHRLVQEQALAARGQEQCVDGLHQQPHAERLVAVVAQPRVDAALLVARGGRKRLRELALHQEPCRVDQAARLGDAQLHGCELCHAAVAAGDRTAGGAHAGHGEEIGKRALRHAEHRRHDGDRQHREK